MAIKKHTLDMKYRVLIEGRQFYVRVEQRIILALLLAYSENKPHPLQKRSPRVFVEFRQCSVAAERGFVAPYENKLSEIYVQRYDFKHLNII